MLNAALLHQNATWRSDAARLRAGVTSCTIVTNGAYGMKPASKGHFTAIGSTRRGAPPQ